MSEDRKQGRERRVSLPPLRLWWLWVPLAILLWPACLLLQGIADRIHARRELRATREKHNRG